MFTNSRRIQLFRVAQAGLLLAAIGLAPSALLRWLLFAALAVGMAAVYAVRRRDTAVAEQLQRVADGGSRDTHTLDPLLQAAVDSVAIRIETAQRAQQQMASVLNGMSDAIFVVDGDGQIVDANAAVTRLLGWDPSALQGKQISSLLSAEDRDAFQLDDVDREVRDYVMETSAGAVIPVALKGTRLATYGLHVVVVHDVTERRRAERRINYLAKNDGLTRIPNRMQFQHLLQQTIARAHRDGQTLALLYLDVDRFKDVNDTFGHAAGDRALEVLSERLVQILPGNAVVGRLAGDEFAAFLPQIELQSRTALLAIARQLLDELSRVFYLNDTEIYLTVSIGIALCEPPIDNTIDLIRSADIAMYHAKQSGGGTYAFFDPTMNAAATERLVLKSKLRRSLELDELVALYQPLVDLDSGRIVGAEALLRWRLPGYGDIPPSEFIPLAEQSNLIHAIGTWVFRRVCADYVAWKVAGAAPEVVSINLSLRQFGRSTSIDWIADPIREFGLDPATIEFEITESTLMEHVRSGPLLDAIADLGVRMAIDDFGTGYSSLSALRQMPVHTLKIDQSFVHRCTERDDDATLVKTIVEMGRNLSLDVVAEGIETAAQRDLLTRLGCHRGQGRLFGSPMTAAEFQVQMLRHASPVQDQCVRSALI